MQGGGRKGKKKCVLKKIEIFEYMLQPTQQLYVHQCGIVLAFKLDYNVTGCTA